MNNTAYIPALRFHWLTNIYDWLISCLMPEKKFKQQLVNNANIQNNDNVLDFGTGTLTLAILAYNTNPNANYTGIDVDENILKIAQSKLKFAKANINIHLYNGGKLPYNDNSFNKIITSLVIHHLTDSQKVAAFTEMYRVLTPNGELHIADFGKPSNYIMRLCFYLVQFLDGFKTTTSNVNGNLPILIKKGSFSNVQITHAFNSIIGTIQIFKVTK